MSELQNFKNRAQQKNEQEKSIENELYAKLDNLFSELHSEIIKLNVPTKNFKVVVPEKRKNQTAMQKLLFAPEIIPAKTIFDKNGWTIFGGEEGCQLVDRVDYYYHNSEVFMLESGEIALYDRGESWINNWGQAKRGVNVPSESVYKAYDQGPSGIIVDNITAYKFLLEKAQPIQRKTRYNNYDSILELIEPNILKLINS